MLNKDCASATKRVSPQIFSSNELRNCFYVLPVVHIFSLFGAFSNSESVSVPKSNVLTKNQTRRLINKFFSFNNLDFMTWF